MLKELKNAIIVKLKCKIDLPKTGKPCWNEKPVVFDGILWIDNIRLLKFKENIKKIKKCNNCEVKVQIWLTRDRATMLEWGTSDVWWGFCE